MTIAVAENSLLRFADNVDVDGLEFFDMVDTISIPQQTDDLTYQISTGDRIDRLAQRFYGDPVLWWILAQANDLEILPTELVVGSVLRIPSPSYVQRVLFQTSKG